MKWISIKERKPSINQIVFALIKRRIPVVVKFVGECFTDDGLEIKNITHWITIPAIY